MDTTETKQLIARHFDYSPHGTGQFFHGEWFTPKHKDSLSYLLDEIDADVQRTISDAEARAEKAEEKAGELAEKLEEIEHIATV